MQLLEFIRYLYLSQKNKLFIAIFIVALTAVQLVNEGIDATTFLGFILGLAFVMVAGRQKFVRALVILVGIPCILLAIITGYHPPEGYQGSISGFVVGGVIILLHREYVHYQNTIKK
ncbi:hypothetical protein [Moellerella wisconsensis]|uniref:hypothetical protein n=1 Tax=Moellerella wisconsensis TaxID=158849 RepID=UPI003076130D